MLLHLPVVILTTLTPIAISDTVPKFDIVRECRFEGGPAENVNRCAQDEASALGQLNTEWTQLLGADKSTCLSATATGGFSSYVELLTCLEMARDARQTGDNAQDSSTGDSMRAAGAEITVASRRPVR